MTDNPFTVRDAEVWWGRIPLRRAAADHLLAKYIAEPGNFPPNRADQLRAAMAEAYHIQDEAA